MSVLKYNKIYVYLPGRIPCGGAELAHQLVDYLRKHKKEAYMVYGDDLKLRSANPVMDCYAKYDIKTISEIEDSIYNVLVLPETAYNMAKLFPNIQVACWWMSVDNFVQHELHYHKFHWNYNKKWYPNIRKWTHVMLCHLPLKRFDILHYLRKEHNRVIHLYQSQYACEYIKEHRLPKSYLLSDYINKELFPAYNIDKSKKENIILYNPRKGLEFTKMLIEYIPEYEFIPLQGMNRQELNNIFDKAKLYIDFGNFPGKDRLPREAVLHDCCIITGKNGASAYYEDVPINDKYKFNTIESNIPIIKKTIKNIMDNYDSISKEFENYKEIVSGEQNAFYSEIKSIFL